MVWINLFILLSLANATELPKLLTKHANETIRFISMDGRFAYVQKRQGVLGLVSNFRSTDFLSDSSYSDFLITGSRFKTRLAIEIIPYKHNEYNLIKNHKIFVVSWGNTQIKEIGLGRDPKLHLQDEWITYYNGYEKIIHVQNIETQKKYAIRLAPKKNPFFFPEVQMISSDTIVYSDINEHGIASVIAHNLLSKKNNVIYKGTQTGTRAELCQHEGYLAIGEFPYEGVTRGSQIMQIKLATGSNLAGYSTIYSTVEQDIGNMICQKDALYFIKTTGQDKALTIKTTEAVKLDLKTQKIEIKSSMGNLSQLIEMDDRIVVPLRGDLYVLEGQTNLETDTLKQTPGSKEEIPLEI